MDVLSLKSHLLPQTTHLYYNTLPSTSHTKCKLVSHDHYQHQEAQAQTTMPHCLLKKKHQTGHSIMYLCEAMHDLLGITDVFNIIQRSLFHIHIHSHNYSRVHFKSRMNVPHN